MISFSIENFAKTNLLSRPLNLIFNLKNCLKNQFNFVLNFLPRSYRINNNLFIIRKMIFVKINVIIQLNTPTNFLSNVDGH